MRTNLLLIVSMFAFVFALNAQIPEYWYLDEVNPGMDIALYPDGTNPQDGSFACRMTLLQPEVPYLISDNFDVTAGESYTLTIWYYDNDDRASLKFYADFYDAQGNDIYGEDPVYSEDGDMWQSVSWSATVPAGAVEGYILIKLYDDEGYVDEAIVWVDNVSFLVGSNNLVLNGSYESWPGVGIDNPMVSTKVNIFPNPVLETAKMEDLSGVERIEIRNQIGALMNILQTNGKERIEVDLSDLSSGVYFVTYYSKAGNIETQKILKH